LKVAPPASGRFYGINPSLTTLHLDNEISDAGTIELADALKTNRSLTKLGLSDNRIGADGAKALADALKTNRSLTKLDLSDNRIGVDGAKALADALKTNHSLIELVLERNRIGDAGVIDAGAVELVRALKDNHGLRRLSLDTTNVGDALTKELATTLKDNQTLTTLELNDNEICNAGAKALAALLRENHSLSELFVANNHIADGGAKALADALKTNRCLARFDLKRNRICNAGANELAMALSKNQSLTELDLGDNLFGDAGVEALAQALKANKSLTKLKVETDVNAQLQASREKRSVTKLKLDLCKLRDAPSTDVKTLVEFDSKPGRKEQMPFERSKQSSTREVSQAVQRLRLNSEEPAFQASLQQADKGKGKSRLLEDVETEAEAEYGPISSPTDDELGGSSYIDEEYQQIQPSWLEKERRLQYILEQIPQKLPHSKVTIEPGRYVRIELDPRDAPVADTTLRRLDFLKVFFRGDTLLRALLKGLSREGDTLTIDLSSLADKPEAVEQTDRLSPQFDSAEIKEPEKAPLILPPKDEPKVGSSSSSSTQKEPPSSGNCLIQ
jgi:Ran GTPase-activating protein (RanGAP) involved in mRNA processing and transport